MVSLLLDVWNGGGCTAAVLPSAVEWLVPYSSHCSAGEYCCHVVHCSLPGVWCVGGGCVSVVFVWWGILCALPPRCCGGGAVVVVVGPLWRVGGIAKERAGTVVLTSPSAIVTPLPFARWSC